MNYTKRKIILVISFLLEETATASFEVLYFS
jgi:hypothetical protein